jgi:two-component system, NtrC family, nitrogen regulation sensor histidine kinase NtrY
MIYKRFNVLITVRIGLLIANVVMLSSILGDARLFFNQVILGLVLIIQVYELLRFVNHTNRELTKFFLAIRHADFSITFRKHSLGKSFYDLQESMAGIVEAYKQVKIEKEAQFHFLRMLVNQMQTGIIAVEDNDHISLINPTAEHMLDAQGVNRWKLLELRNPLFTAEIAALGDGGRKLVEMRRANDTYFLSVDVRTLLMLDKPMKLITLQNINSEIEQKEIEAWHKLIRILTHEIMNSVTPISSLTETMQSLLTGKSGKEKLLHELKQDTISDINFSLNTIQKRSDGLLHFVENYRKLTKVPKPRLEKVYVKPLLESVNNLMSHALARNTITVTVSAEEDMDIMLDPALVEQVIINLVTNSIHAVEGVAAPSIALKGYRNNELQTIIEVTDNGKGIPAKELGEIFVPFFSTKKDGSGIGLSLSKQVMSLHGGTIKVRSVEGEGTSFYLQFK